MKVNDIVALARSRGVPEAILSLAPEDRFPGWPLVGGGAPTSTANLPNILTRTYNRENYFAPHERSMAKFYDGTEDFPDGGKPLGVERRWGIRTKDSHAAGGTAESGDLPAFNPPSVLQAAIAAITVAAAVAWSEVMLSVGQGEGILNTTDIIDDHVKMTTRNIMSALNRLSLGHGTGRMAVVEATTSAATTFVCRNPEHVLQLREGMTIDFFDTDTGGSKQGATETISSINFETRTVTIGNARTLTAGWGVYKALSSTVSEYGIAPTGMRAVVDNATLAASVFGITRSSNPQVNATVLTAGGGTQAYSEKLVRKGLNRIFFSTGLEGEEIWTNRGVVAEHLNHLTGTRVYTVGPGDNTPKYTIGADQEQIAFQHNGKKIPFKIDPDLPARELAILTRSLFRRHILRKTSWVGDGSGSDGSSSPILMQAPGTGANTYALQKVAGLVWMGNFGHLQPKANTRITEIADEELAGDA